MVNTTKWCQKFHEKFYKLMNYFKIITVNPDQNFMKFKEFKKTDKE